MKNSKFSKIGKGTITSAQDKALQAAMLKRDGTKEQQLAAYTMLRNTLTGLPKRKGLISGRLMTTTGQFCTLGAAIATQYPHMAKANSNSDDDADKCLDELGIPASVQSEIVCANDGTEETPIARKKRMIAFIEEKMEELGGMFSSPDEKALVAAVDGDPDDMAVHI